MGWPPLICSSFSRVLWEVFFFCVKLGWRTGAQSTADRRRIGKRLVLQIKTAGPSVTAITVEMTVTKQASKQERRAFKVIMHYVVLAYYSYGFCPVLIACAADTAGH